MKFKYILFCFTVLALAFSLVACDDPDVTTCTSHVDINDNGACDTCAAVFRDGCDAEHADSDNDGKCDFGGEDFKNGCDEPADCLDTDNDGKCDNALCDRDTENKPCVHADADDNGACDKCSAVFRDGCDADHADSDNDGKCDFGGEDYMKGCSDPADCLDTDNDGKCDNALCDRDTENKPCIHADADDDGVCDACQSAFSDGCETHIDLNDDFACDRDGCGEFVDDGIDDGSYRVVSNYLPSSVADIIYGEFENESTSFVRMHMYSAPFSYLDYLDISDCRILSIEIPVLVSKDADENGDFFFTIHEINNTFSGLSMKPVKSHKVKINKDAYGIAPNDNGVYKYITVDLRKYNIELSSSETLAFGALGDTLIPAYLHVNDGDESVALDAFNNYFYQSLGMLKRIGRGYTKATPTAATLCFDFKIEKKYASEADYNEKLESDLRYEQEYEAMVEQLKAIYNGKKVSVLGDSISTYNGLSNNQSINMTLDARGGIMYPDYEHTISKEAHTYWGRVIDELDMTLCVDNAWGGTRVFGSQSRNYTDSAVLRASELHQDKGTTTRNDDVNPDVIIFYMGVNDMDGNGTSSAFGDLNSILVNKNDTRSDSEKVDAWFKGVLETYNKYGSKPQNANAYTTFEQAYALALYRMKQTYANAEIICLTLVRNRYENLTNKIVEDYGRVITAIATYFGAAVADQNGPYAELSFENGFRHTAAEEYKSLHPNRTGHEMMANLIIKTLAEKHGIAVPQK